MSTMLVSIEAPGEVRLVEEKSPDVPEGGFMVETVYSGVSAGTELTYVKGTNPYLHSSWDPALGLFTEGVPSVAYPVRGIGYMQVGRVVEARTRAVAEGTLVAMCYGHRTAYVADPMTDRFVPVPDDLDPLLGVYVAHMGPICANGLLHAAHDLHGPAVGDLGDGVRGRRIAVVGAGVVGLLTASFALSAGAAEVVVVDETLERLAVAEALGANVLAADDDPAVVLKRRWRHGQNDRGADVVFQCRGQASAGRWPWGSGCCARRARWWTWPSTRRERMRCGSARSSTTTGCRSAAPRSAGCRAAWRTPGTGSASRTRRSSCSGSAAGCYRTT